MKSAFVILMICFVFVACGEEIEPLKPLQKGMQNTFALSTGGVVYDINGKWDCITDAKGFGTFQDDVKITQQGNKFVGIYLNGNVYWDKGSEIIKGELEKNGFKSLQKNTRVNGWMQSVGKIDEGCNKFVVKTDITGQWIDVTFTRK